MLDTNICSFIMRERPLPVLERLQAAAKRQNSIVVSVITYCEMLLGVTGRKAAPRHMALVDSFIPRLSAILLISPGVADQAKPPLFPHSAERPFDRRSPLPHFPGPFGAAGGGPRKSRAAGSALRSLHGRRHRRISGQGQDDQQISRQEF
jgi:hypothetical protein